MNILYRPIIVLLIFVSLSSCQTTGAGEPVFVLIKTNLGDIKVKLFDNTPLHRDNFIKLVNNGYYEGIQFHRVIKDFMIQAGDPLTKPDPSSLPDSLKTFTLPAEFIQLNYHKKGALAAARQGNEINPYMRSSGTQFYIVQGKKLSDTELDNAEQTINSLIKQARFNIIMRETIDSLKASGKSAADSEIQEIASDKMFRYLNNTPDYKFTPEQREIYKTAGGTPRLDGTYTVFGEVTEGLDIVDRIASEKTDPSDRPVSSITILKMKIVRK